MADSDPARSGSVVAPRTRDAGFVAYPYDRVAWCYDALAALYSLGRIGRSRRHHLEFLEPDARVLYAGVGRGREAIAAARRGARVTAVDLSPAMLGRLEREARYAGVALELVEAEVSRVAETRRFDWVVAHYFLNLFDVETAREMLRALVACVRPGGRICLADFAPSPVGSGTTDWRTRANYAPLNAIAAALGFCARHPIPDLEAWCEAEGLRVVDCARFPLPGLASPAYWTVIAERPGVPPEVSSGKGSGEGARDDA